MKNAMDNLGYKYDPIKPIIYAKPERAHYCDIHRETFLFLRSIFGSREKKHHLKILLRIIKFIYKRKFFTKNDLIKELHISYNTINKYLRFLKQLKLCRTQKRTINEIKNNIPKKYVFISNQRLREIVFFIEHNFKCPIFLMPKDTPQDKLFNQMRSFVYEKKQLKQENLNNTL